MRPSSDGPVFNNLLVLAVSFRPEWSDADSSFSVAVRAGAYLCPTPDGFVASNFLQERKTTLRPVARAEGLRGSALAEILVDLVATDDPRY